MTYELNTQSVEKPKTGIARTAVDAVLWLTVVRPGVDKSVTEGLGPVPAVHELARATAGVHGTIEHELRAQRAQEDAPGVRVDCSNPIGFEELETRVED